MSKARAPGDLEVAGFLDVTSYSAFGPNPHTAGILRLDGDMTLTDGDSVDWQSEISIQRQGVNVLSTIAARVDIQGVSQTSGATDAQDIILWGGNVTAPAAGNTGGVAGLGGTYNDGANDNDGALFDFKGGGSSSGGGVTFSAGDAAIAGSAGGNVSISSGDGTGADGGNVTVTAGSGSSQGTITHDGLTHTWKVGDNDKMSLSATELDLQSNNILTTGYIALGAGPAGTGAIRLSSGDAIYSEVSPAGNDAHMMGLDASEVLTVGDAANVSTLRMHASAGVRVYAGGSYRAEFTPTVADLKDSIVITTDHIRVGTTPYTSGTLRIDGDMTLTATDSIDWRGEVSIQRQGVNVITSTASSVDFSANALVTTGYIALGAGPAGTGAVRLSSGTSNGIYGESSPAGTALHMMSVSGSVLALGSGADVTTLQLKAANEVSTWVAGVQQLAVTATTIDARDNNILTTGVIALGTSPASSGRLRLGTTDTIKFRNVANTADINALDIIGSDIVSVGDPTNTTQVRCQSSTSHEFYVGGTSQLLLNATAANFQDNALVTTGYLALGAGPAGTGAIRLSNNERVKARNSAGNGDLDVLYVNASDVLRFGNSTGSVLHNSGATHTFQVGGATEMALSATELDLQSNNIVTTGYLDVSDFQTNATGIGFFGATPVAKPTITGSRAGNAALASALTQFASLGLITDSSTA